MAFGVKARGPRIRLAPRSIGGAGHWDEKRQGSVKQLDNPPFATRCFFRHYARRNRLDLSTVTC